MQRANLASTARKKGGDLMGFDFESLRVTEVSPIVVKRVVNSIQLKKPTTGVDFIRIRSGSDWKFKTYILDLGGKIDGEGKFLLDKALYSEVIETKRLKLVTIYTGITYEGNIFLTEIAEPDAEGKDNEFNRTRRLTYEVGEIKWVKHQMNTQKWLMIRF